MDLMRFESSQAPEMLGPVLVEQALDDVPIFGPEGKDLNSIVEKATSSAAETYVLQDLDADDRPLPEAFTNASTTAEKLRALRAHVKAKPGRNSVDAVTESVDDLSLSTAEPPTNCELHEELLSTLIAAQGLPREAWAVIDHVMLLRAREKYLFNTSTNITVVDDDPWLRYLWGWIRGESRPTGILPLIRADSCVDAEAATEEGGMMAHPLDLNYLGVFTIWTNDLGTAHPFSTLLPFHY